MTQQTAPFSAKTIDEKIMAHAQMVKDLAALKAQERELRDEIIAAKFDTETVGTQNVPLGNGWVLKGVIKESRDFDLTTHDGARTKEQALDAIEGALDKLPEWLQDRIAKWTPKLSVSEYKKLEPEHRAIVDKVIVTKPAAPTLTLVEPKTKG